MSVIEKAEGEKTRARDLFACASSGSCVRSREDLAEVRHPQAQNSVAALQLFNALPSLLALSVDDIVEAVHPPAEMSVLALPLHTALSLAEELPIEKRLASSSASLRGRLRCMSQGGRWAIRAAARQGASSSAHAAGFSRSHACTHRKPLRKSSL